MMENLDCAYCVRVGTLVGTLEVTTYLLTYRDAKRLAESYAKDGYNASIERRLP